MAPEKGLHRLIDAFIAIADLPEAKHVRLKLAGWMGPQHETFWSEQKAKLAHAGLDQRWEYLGSIDRTEKANFCDPSICSASRQPTQNPRGSFCWRPLLPALNTFNLITARSPRSISGSSRSRGGRHLGTLFQADSPADLSAKLMAGIRTNQKNEPASDAVLAELGIKRHAERVLDCIG